MSEKTQGRIQMECEHVEKKIEVKGEERNAKKKDRIEWRKEK
jgi:hypothetical protein